MTPAADIRSRPARRGGKTRWRRFACVAAPGLMLAGVLAGMTAQGAIASSISVSGEQYLVTARQLHGTGFVQFGGQVTSGQGGSQVTRPVITSGIASATISSLCQSVRMGPVTMRLTAGSGRSPVSASNMIIDASGQAGSEAVFRNVSVGADASTLTKDGPDTGPAGGFGQQADSVTIDNLRQDTWLTTAGTFTLPGLSLGFGRSC